MRSDGQKIYSGSAFVRHHGADLDAHERHGRNARPARSRHIVRHRHRHGVDVLPLAMGQPTKALSRC